MIIASAATIVALAGAQVPRTKAPAGASVYFVSPADGATVSGPVKVVMGLSGMGVAPAGVDAPDTGHHHLLVNVDRPVLDQPLPADDSHRHFGKGQTETAQIGGVVIGARFALPQRVPALDGPGPCDLILAPAESRSAMMLAQEPSLAGYPR